MITTTTTISSSTATRAGSGTGSIVDESPRVDDIPSMTATTDHRNPLRPATQEQSICTTDSDLPSNEETSTIRVTDVLCGRGKVDHAGNAYFRQVVAEQLNDFKYHQSQKNRHGMSMVVQRIVQKVHETGGRFMDQNWRGMWVELSEKERRQKVDRACRDAKKNSVSSKSTTAPIASMVSSSTVTTTATVLDTEANVVYSSSSNRKDLTTTGIHYGTIPNHVSATPATNTVALPPSTIARLYPLTSGKGMGSSNSHNSSSTNTTIYNSISDKNKNKRNSSGQRIQTATGAPSTTTNNDRTNGGEVSSASVVVMDVPSSLSAAQLSTTTVGSHAFHQTTTGTQEPQKHLPPSQTMAVSDFFHIGNPKYRNNQPLHGDHINPSQNSNMLDSSISSLDKITQASTQPLSSLPYMTAPSLEFSCGSLALDNSFVLTENHSNPSISHHNESTSMVSSLRSAPSQQPSQGQGQNQNAVDLLPKKPSSHTNMPHSNNTNNNNASSTWMTASISSIPNDFLNRSVISEMDFSAVSLDLFTPIEEEEGGTEHCTDTEENETANVRARTNSTTSTATTATSTDTNDPMALLRGEHRNAPQRQRMNDSMNNNNINNNESAIMMDASVGVLDLNQSYPTGSFFDASFINNNNNSLMVESSSTTAKILPNPNERTESIHLPFDPNSSAPQQRDRFLDRYDLLKREESVDTIIAGNLRRHSQISKAGGGTKVTDDNENDLSASFNMSLDICALPSTNEEDDEEETPKPERVVKTPFLTQLQQPQPLISDQYHRSPEKKKIKDYTLSPSMSQLTSTNIKNNISSVLWSSTEEFTINRGNDSASVTSSLFSAG